MNPLKIIHFKKTLAGVPYTVQKNVSSVKFPFVLNKKTLCVYELLLLSQ